MNAKMTWLIRCFSHKALQGNDDKYHTQPCHKLDFSLLSVGQEGKM